jgi:Zn-dependent M16 (insulinase) family peptidase
MEIPILLRELHVEPVEFWLTLLQEQLLEAPFATVLMIPDRALATQLAEEEQRQLERRITEFAPEGLERLGTEVQKALEENQVRLSPAMIQQMPSLLEKDGATNSTTSTAPYQVYHHQWSNSSKKSPTNKNQDCFPLGAMQVVRTQTTFHHVRFGLPIHHIPAELRPWLVLFQELLFQCPLELEDQSVSRSILETAIQGGFTEDTVTNSHESSKAHTNGNHATALVDYRAVVRALSMDLVHYEAAVGFSNETFSCGWLSDCLMLVAQGEYKNTEKIEPNNKSNRSVQIIPTSFPLADYP